MLLCIFLQLVTFADVSNIVTVFFVQRVQYGIKKRDSDANVSSLAVRDDGRKKLSSAGLSGDLQPNQGIFSMFCCEFWKHHFDNVVGRNLLIVRLSIQIRSQSYRLQLVLCLFDNKIQETHQEMRYSECELSLQRHRTCTIKYNNIMVHEFRHRSTLFVARHTR